MLCGGEPFVSSDTKLKGGYFLSPCVLGKELFFYFLSCLCLIWIQL